MLFSATMPGAIVSLARTHMRHPMNIRAESGDAQQTVPATAQFIYQVHDLDKPELISRILQAENSGLTIVFTRTKRAAQRLAEDLDDRGFDASPLHGDMQQVAREKALARFREGKLRVLVATDVAARGIDVADVTHVINYSCPEDEKTYVHRIGRTGRAGASGIAVTFVDWADVTRWKTINKALALPFEDPAETYSTSEHFYHDMGIAPGTKGRLKPEKPAEPRVKTERSGGRSSGGRSGSGSGGGSGRGSGDSAPREDRPRRNRSRSRTRSGEKVDGATASAPAQAQEAGASAGGDTAGRSRSRRRRSGNSSSATTTD
jgi:superfamily II DNA/RNA helicase